jgi:ribosomal protein L40E
VAISNRNYNNNTLYDIDARLDEKLRSSLSSVFEENNEKLRKLKDVKTLVDCYNKTREYGQQDRYGILSIIVNKIIEELLNQAESYYVGSIVKRIDAETQFKKEGVVEINSNISLGAPIKPFVVFTIAINRKESYSVKFTFEIDISAHITKLRIIRNADRGKSVIIEKLGVTIELSLLQIEFSDLILQWSEFSLNRQMLLGRKSFEIHDISLYAERNDDNKNTIICPKCNTLNSPESEFCIHCSTNL